MKSRIKKNSWPVLMKNAFIFFFLIVVSNTAFGQYYNQTKTIYSDKQGNLYVVASHTSTNLRVPDKTIYLKSQNVNSKSREMLIWTNGSLNEVDSFVSQLLRGFDRGVGSTFQINYIYVAHVEDANTIKVNHTMGGVSYFNKSRIQMLQQALKGME